MSYSNYKFSETAVNGNRFSKPPSVGRTAEIDCFTQVGDVGDIPIGDQVAGPVDVPLQFVRDAYAQHHFTGHRQGDAILHVLRVFLEIVPTGGLRWTRNVRFIFGMYPGKDSAFLPTVDNFFSAVNQPVQQSAGYFFSPVHPIYRQYVIFDEHISCPQWGYNLGFSTWAQHPDPIQQCRHIPLYKTPNSTIDTYYTVDATGPPPPAGPINATTNTIYGVNTPVAPAPNSILADVDNGAGGTVALLNYYNVPQPGDPDEAHLGALPLTASVPYSREFAAIFDPPVRIRYERGEDADSAPCSPSMFYFICSDRGMVLATDLPTNELPNVAASFNFLIYREFLELK